LSNESGSEQAQDNYLAALLEAASAEIQKVLAASEERLGVTDEPAIPVRSAILFIEVPE
jgi:hypothetical protein